MAACVTRRSSTAPIGFDPIFIQLMRAIFLLDFDKAHCAYGCSFLRFDEGMQVDQGRSRKLVALLARFRATSRLPFLFFYLNFVSSRKHTRICSPVPIYRLFSICVGIRSRHAWKEMGTLLYWEDQQVSRCQAARGLGISPRGVTVLTRPVVFVLLHIPRLFC